MSLSRAQIACLAAVAATCVLTIFGAQILLTLGVLFFLARLVTGQTTFPNLPVDAPILAFIVWTLLSSSFSADPGESFRTGNKKLVLFILIYIAVDSLVDETWRERILAALLLGGAALSLGLIVQYHLLGFDTLDHRPTGFLGHWMTASGLIMASLVMAVARLLSLKRPLPRPAREDIVLAAGIVVCMLILTLLRRLDLFSIEADRLFIIGVVLVALRLVIDNERWPGPATAPTLAWLVVPIATWALLVSQTRSAWLGVVAGLTAVAVLRAPRLLWALGAAIVIVLIARPAPVMNRLTIKDMSSIDRYYMWQAGLEMIRDRPIFGQGPGMIPAAYRVYRWPEAPQTEISHLHNNVLQVAAERGLPALLFWLWWVASVMGDAYREARRRLDWAPLGACGVFVALLMAGMFEYNFGDSEVLYLALIAAAWPYALRRQREQAT